MIYNNGPFWVKFVIRQFFESTGLFSPPIPFVAPFAGVGRGDVREVFGIEAHDIQSEWEKKGTITVNGKNYHYSFSSDVPQYHATPSNIERWVTHHIIESLNIERIGCLIEGRVSTQCYYQIFFELNDPNFFQNRLELIQYFAFKTNTPMAKVLGDFFCSVSNNYRRYSIETLHCIILRMTESLLDMNIPSKIWDNISNMIEKRDLLKLRGELKIDNKSVVQKHSEWCSLYRERVKRIWLMRFLKRNIRIFCLLRLKIPKDLNQTIIDFLFSF